MKYWKKVLFSCIVSIIFFVILMIFPRVFLDENSIKEHIGFYNYVIIKEIIRIIIAFIPYSLMCKSIFGSIKRTIVLDENEKANFKLSVLLGMSAILIEGIPFLILVGMNSIKIEGFSEDFCFLGFLSISLNIMFTAVTEEFGCRSLLYGIINEKYGFFSAVIITSIVFSFLHLMQDITFICIVNLFLFSVFTILINRITNTIVTGIIFHFLWNLLNSVIFSLKMYGSIYFPYLLNVEVGGKKYLSGGETGLENSLFTTALFIISILIVYRIILRKKREI